MSVKIALAGNPNSGKTTLFNALTGSNQFVGNWPGVTVEKKEGKLKSDKSVVITDLPGVYSLSPYTLEEVVSRNYLLNEKPDAILNIVDGTNLERNLYLTTQLAELSIPVVVAVNMADVIEKKGDKINCDKLAQKLGVEVVEISALKGTNIDKAAELAVKKAQEKKDFVCNHKFSNDIENAIISIGKLLEGKVEKSKKRWYSIKLFERDDKIIEALKLDKSTSDAVEGIVKKYEKQFDDDSESIITNERYTYISSIINDCIKRKNTGKLSASDKIDRVVTNRFAALPIFIVIMFIVYYISVSTVGTIATDWANDGVFGDGWHLFGIGSSEYDDATTKYAVENVWTPEVKEIISKAANAEVVGAEDILNAVEDEDFGAFDETYASYGEALTDSGYDISELVDPALEEAPAPEDYGIWIPGIPVFVENGLNAVNCADWLQSLILDGIIAGVGAVLGFVPQMLVLFIFLGILESCGYMARVAFIMDRIFRKFGLSGKSFIPMLIGTGCGVPGIMASRTIENDRDRKMTIMTTTFIPCGAKMPIIALIAGALFGGAWWIAPSAYFIGIAAIVVSGIILKKTKMFSGDPAPFVMELPAYHLPTVGNVLRSMWERGWSFIKKAGTIILLSSILIWAGSCFGILEGGAFGFSTELELENSVLGMIGSAICWIFAPLGFGNIKAAIATIMGLVAKEEVVGVFGVLDFEGLTQLAAFSFMVFNLLCAPCFAAIGAMKRELNSGKWLAFAVGYQCVFAYAVSLCIFQIGSLFTGAFSIGAIFAFAVAALFLFLLFRPYKESNTLKSSVVKKLG